MEAVAAIASGFKVQSWGPGEGAGVYDLLGDGVEGNDVVGGALQQDEGKGAVSRWLPCDGVLDAYGHNLVEAGLCGWVAAIDALGSLLLHIQVSTCSREQVISAGHVLGWCKHWQEQQRPREQRTCTSWLRVYLRRKQHEFKEWKVYMNE